MFNFLNKNNEKESMKKSNVSKYSKYESDEKYKK